MIPSNKENIKISFKKSHTKTKEFAFMKAHELNNMEKLHKKTCYCYNEDNIPFPDCKICNGHGYYYEKVKWRVGKNTNKQLVIDIDGKDKHNLKAILRRLKNLFQYDFVPVDTNIGFQLIGMHVYKPIVYISGGSDYTVYSQGERYTEDELSREEILSAIEEPSTIEQEPLIKYRDRSRLL